MYYERGDGGNEEEDGGTKNRKEIPPTITASLIFQQCFLPCHDPTMCWSNCIVSKTLIAKGGEQENLNAFTGNLSWLSVTVTMVQFTHISHNFDSIILYQPFLLSLEKNFIS